jgi:hypothetical protein
MIKMVITARVVMRLHKEGKQSESLDACLAFRGGYNTRTQWVMICMLCYCVRESKDIESDFSFFLFSLCISWKSTSLGQGWYTVFLFLIRNVYVFI